MAHEMLLGFGWFFLPFSCLLQAKCWTQTCATTSVCSFRRARSTTNYSRSYETTSTYAPYPVSTPSTLLHKALKTQLQTTHVHPNPLSAYVCFYVKHLLGVLKMLWETGICISTHFPLNSSAHTQNHCVTLQTHVTLHCYPQLLVRHTKKHTLKHHYSNAAKDISWTPM